MADLLRQSAYRIAGDEDVNDTKRLSPDPAFRLIGAAKPDDQAVSAGEVSK